MKTGFICEHCGKFVPTDSYIGTAYRNHCPYCLWSKHLGQENPDDKVRPCQGMMKPIGLTFKQEGFDKFTKKPKQGEIMIVHQCLGCGTVTINRIAADDEPEAILKLLDISQVKVGTTDKNIEILNKGNKEEVKTQLFGK